LITISEPSIENKLPEMVGQGILLNLIKERKENTYVPKYFSKEIG